MSAYTEDEKRFIEMISEKAAGTDRFFQLLVSENFFKEQFNILMLVDHGNKQVVLFFNPGKKHDEFFRFMNLVALMEDLENDRLIARIPMSNGTYFIGELSDATQQVDATGIVRYTSKKTGRFIKQNDLSNLFDSTGGPTKKLDPVVFNDPLVFERLSNAFSGLVYPREALRDLVKNKFHSLTKRHHQQTMMAAWTAIFVSVVVALSSVWFSLRNDRDDTDVSQVGPTEAAISSGVVENVSTQTAP